MKLTIGSPVKKKKNPTNVFVMHVDHMHGDADVYTHSSHEFVKEEEAGIFAFAKFCDEADHLHGSDLDDAFEKLCEENEFLGEGMLDGDSTCDHQWKAKPSIKKIVWFDEHGVEHDVKIEK